MRRFIAILGGLLLSAASTVSASSQAPMPAPAGIENYLIWSEAQIAELQQQVDARTSEGLENCSITDFSQPNSASDPYRRSRLATIAANELMMAYLEGCSPASARASWRRQTRRE